MPSSQKIKKEDDGRQMIRIKIRAYDHATLDRSAEMIIETAKRSGSKTRGPIPLPTAKTIYTVNSSTFIYKDAREQYEMRVHKRLIDIFEPTAKTTEALQHLNLPAGVDIEMKI